MQGSAHKSHVPTQAIRDLGFNLFEHLHYTPDLALSNYHIFPQLKNKLKVRKFSSNKEEIEAMEVWFTAQDRNLFLKSLEVLQVRCNKFIQLREENSK